MDLIIPKKAHRSSKSGAKANKKNDKKQKKLQSQGKASAGKKQNNPKAFNVANIVRTKRTQQRNLDRLQQKELVPLVDKTGPLYNVIIEYS